MGQDSSKTPAPFTQKEFQAIDSYLKLRQVDVDRNLKSFKDFVHKCNEYKKATDTVPKGARVHMCALAMDATKRCKNMENGAIQLHEKYPDAALNALFALTGIEKLASDDAINRGLRRALAVNGHDTRAWNADQWQYMIGEMWERSTDRVLM